MRFLTISAQIVGEKVRERRLESHVSYMNVIPEPYHFPTVGLLFSFTVHPTVGKEMKGKAMEW